ncbi:MAG: 2Fe-2S iron-sulfur cluster-binding protein [Capsulimonadales bacterium]|nr:2Fe-2S iron-sulfur cluster-binding protein [Capsulimonadales bacterium]
MPKVTVEGHGTFDVPENKKLVLGLEDAGIPMLHRCGGVPACTTCRVKILSGEVAPMQEAEKEALEEPELIANYRLSCQIRVQNDLTVELWKTLPEFRAENNNPELGPGDRPAD